MSLHWTLNEVFHEFSVKAVTSQRLCNFLIKYIQYISYISICSFQGTYRQLLSLSDTYWLVGLSGLEPPTSRLSGVRSNRLSYKPIEFGGHLLSHIVSNIVPSAV